MNRHGRIVELDVRLNLRKKLDPFQRIMEAVATPEQEHIFLLHVIFKPTPLLGVMKVKGYTNRVEEIEADHWIAAFAKGSQAKERLAAIDFKQFAKPEEQEEGNADANWIIAVWSLPSRWYARSMR
ncbi:DUF2249 domain-containing protein [Paenibacillus hamazuiensis]|uniref:DUF2249 domain-containing protein n=1 Tax=Paenibacillus hamazuiensis TaxID=2936508 RepID=UPI00200E9AC8|nr:DUF2249 domain-containing protein [Paenibacillus hamazuiensis]